MNVLSKNILLGGGLSYFLNQVKNGSSLPTAIPVIQEKSMYKFTFQKFYCWIFCFKNLTLILISSFPSCFL